MTPILSSDIAQTIYSLSDDNYAIATQLVVECALSTHSDFYPYMRILPESVPNLESFSEEELEMLQSPSLAAKGREARAKTERTYDSLEPYMKQMLEVYVTKIKDSVPRSSLDQSCLSLESFRHYAAVVGSRAMVLNGMKHMTPLADMANYQPNLVEREIGENGKSFLTYHVLSSDGSMTVKADQDVGESSQIFEDYGDNPNYLYLEAHGFVPSHNPFNCADLNNPPVSDLDVIDTMRQLRIVDDNDYSPPACIDANGVIPPYTRAYAYYAMLALEDSPESFAYCQDRIKVRSAGAALWLSHLQLKSQSI